MPLDPDVVREQGRLTAWLKSGDYLPAFLRDFHDQKDMFKSIHLRLDRRAKADEGFQVKPESWVDAHIYTIDAFLWFMARCGYTLQRSRKKLTFTDVGEFQGTFQREYQHPWGAAAMSAVPQGSEKPEAVNDG